MTPTLKQLCERATKGPWPMHPIRSGDKWIDILAPAVRVDYDDVNHDEARANAQLIARCSPDTMLRVYEALERAKERLDYRNGRTHDLINEALRLLDGAAQQDKEDKP